KHQAEQRAHSVHLSGVAGTAQRNSRFRKRCIHRCQIVLQHDARPEGNHSLKAEHIMKLINICLLLFIAAIPVLAQEKPTTQKFEREGVEVEFTIEPIKEAGKSSELMEAKEATVRFKINDKAS